MRPETTSEHAVGDDGEQWKYWDELDQKIGHDGPILKARTIAPISTRVSGTRLRSNRWFGWMQEHRWGEAVG
jgi:hypothetical protein